MFCSRCGHEVGDADRYCPSCSLALSPATIASTPPLGMSASGAAGHVGSVDGDDPDADLVEGPAGPGGRRGWGVAVSRRRLLLGVGLVVLALIGVGAWTAVRDRSPGTFFFSAYGEDPLSRPVTSVPEQRWRRDLPSDVGSWAVQGDGVTFISSIEQGRTTIVAVETDGHERWSANVDGDAYVVATSGDGSVLFVLPWVSSEEGPRVVRAISTQDGSELWTSDEGEPGRFVDDGVILFGDTIQLLDAQDGRAVWGVSRGDASGINTRHLLVSDAGALTAFDILTGDALWTTDDGAACSSAASCTIAAADEVILVKDHTKAVALDPDDGDVLWEVRIEESAEVGAASSELVYVNDVIDAANGNAGSVTIYGRDGERGQLQLPADESWFFPVGVTTAGGSYVLDLANGTVYDDELDVVDQIDGELSLTGGGVYAVGSDEVAYHRFDQSDPVWRLTFGAGPTAAVSGDGSILVIWEDAVALYE